eukprot:GHVL01044846.1.p1 GENE.GHVL01044846.1~~GHVL01044846.1.p1  ORF type:complete len:541 (+),score=50.43 GHVL01044846.1:170-1624(+)
MLGAENKYNCNSMSLRVDYVGWLILGCSDLQIDPNVMSRAVLLVDKYMFLMDPSEREPFFKDTSAVLSLCVASVASSLKYEIQPSKSQEYSSTVHYRCNIAELATDFSKNNCSVEKVLEAEIELLNALKFDIAFPTPIEFGNIFAIGIPQFLTLKPLKNVYHFITGIAMLHEKMWTFKGSTIAAAALILSIYSSFPASEVENNLALLFEELQVVNQLSTSIFSILLESLKLLVCWWIEATCLITQDDQLHPLYKSFKNCRTLDLAHNRDISIDKSMASFIGQSSVEPWSITPYLSHLFHKHAMKSDETLVCQTEPKLFLTTVNATINMDQFLLLIIAVREKVLVKSSLNHRNEQLTTLPALDLICSVKCTEAKPRKPRAKQSRSSIYGATRFTQYSCVEKNMANISLTKRANDNNERNDDRSIKNCRRPNLRTSCQESTNIIFKTKHIVRRNAASGGKTLLRSIIAADITDAIIENGPAKKMRL